jgi:hypothetical protein
VRSDEHPRSEGEDDADQHRARGSRGGDQHHQDQHGAADDAFGRQHRELVGQRLITDRDVQADAERRRGAQPFEPVGALALRDEGEGEAEAERHREELLGVERNAEEPARHIQHPADDGEEERRLQYVDCDPCGPPRHSSGFAWMLCSLKYFSAPGW